MFESGSVSQSPAVSQLPVPWYFDERVFAEERRLLFDAGPGYAGHELMLPEPGSFRTQEWRDHGRMIVRGDEGCWEMSNVCRHRQAIMLQGSGRADHVVCPIHRWTYDREGSLIGAPHFPRNPCLHLDRQPLESWNGLLFKGPRSARADLSGLAVPIDFSGHVLDRVEIHECRYNWKTFIEVYLEDYHVEPFHPGLGRFVSCSDLAWQFGERFSVQTVGVTSLEKAGSEVYSRWHKAQLELGGGKPAFGAVWLTYFPNVMVEIYPHAMVVSSLIPTAVDRTTNVVEFYYPEDIAAFEREFVEAHQAAYMETCVEDDEIGERMDRGRRALLAQGKSETGPYQSPLEDGMRHFHEFYRRILGDALS